MPLGYDANGNLVDTGTGSGGDTSNYDYIDLAPGFVQNRVTGETYRQGINPMTGQTELRVATPYDLQQLNQLQQQPSRSVSSSSSVSQSLADPRSLQLQYDQLAQEQLQWERQQSFLEDKFQIETDAGKRQEALQTRQLLEQIGARLANNQIQRQQIQQQADQFQRQMAFDQAVEQQRVQTEARRFAEEQRQFNSEQSRQVANDIAATASKPGDVGQNAALLTALGQPNAISSAIAGGKDLRTEQSLAPLDMLLQQQQQLQQPGLLNGAMNNGTAGVATGDTPQDPARAQQMLRDQLQGQLNAILTGNPSTVGAGTPIEASLAGLANTPGSAIGQNGSSFFARPGTDAAQNGFQGATGQPDFVAAADGFAGIVDQPTVFLAGEGGQPENVNIQPTGQPQPVGVQRGDVGQVTPQQMVQQVSVPQTPQTQTPQTLQFLNQALQRIFGSGPFNQIPTPIGLSAPGTSPYLQQYGASIASLGSGVDPGLFLNEAMQLAPQALQQGITRRV